MDKFTLEKMERKFDMCYLLAKEGMAFKKYPALYSLEERHGVSGARKCLQNEGLSKVVY